jgi:dTMP kinase
LAKLEAEEAARKQAELEAKRREEEAARKAQEEKWKELERNRHSPEPPKVNLPFSDDEDENYDLGIDQEALRQERIRRETEAAAIAAEHAKKLREAEENAMTSQRTQMTSMSAGAASILAKYS